MFTSSAQFYDLLYQWKDYQKESKDIIQLLRQKVPDCQTVLDIGSGTGEHHKHLKEHYTLEGLDLNSEFVEIARSKNPDVPCHIGNMKDFDLGKSYDVILCLFSSIGYMQTVAELEQAFERFCTHLRPGGLAVIEPWLVPEAWVPGGLHMLTCDEEYVKICRMSEAGKQHGLSLLRFHYMVAVEGESVRYFTEDHNMGLYTPEQMISAMERGGFRVEHDETGLTGRGLYYGRKPGKF